MEFGLFKGLLASLFFGSALAVGLLQLAAIKKGRLPERDTRADSTAQMTESGEGV
jgi:hypothetical protein